MLCLRITSVDYAPDDLYRQTPFDAKILRKIPGSDRPDYWLARLLNPIHWLQDGRELEISYLVLAARWADTQISAGIRQLPIGIAYVTDPSLMDDEALDFDKCKYVAVGVAEDAAHSSL
ncbi:MAG: hypothetical protein OER43_12760 [Gammaproteobacteria bacterium]|nr:hypothetical protein [Gammaproteobacteria bacterium]